MSKYYFVYVPNGWFPQLYQLEIIQLHYIMMVNFFWIQCRKTAFMFHYCIVTTDILKQRNSLYNSVGDKDNALEIHRLENNAKIDREEIDILEETDPSQHFTVIVDNVFKDPMEETITTWQTQQNCDTCIINSTCRGYSSGAVSRL